MGNQFSGVKSIIEQTTKLASGGLDVEDKRRNFQSKRKELMLKELQIKTQTEQMKIELEKNDEAIKDKYVARYESGNLSSNGFAEKLYERNVSLREINNEIVSVNKNALSLEQDIKNKKLKPEQVLAEKWSRARRNSTDAIVELDKNGSYNIVGVVDFPSGVLEKKPGEKPIVVTTNTGACPIKERQAGGCMVVSEDELIARRRTINGASFFRKTTKTKSLTETSESFLTLENSSSSIFKVNDKLNRKDNFQYLDLESFDFNDSQNFELKLKALKYFLFEENQLDLYANIMFFLEERPSFKRYLNLFFQENSDFFDEILEKNLLLEKSYSLEVDPNTVNQKKQFSEALEDSSLLIAFLVIGILVGLILSEFKKKKF